MRYRVRWAGKAKSFRTKGEADRHWLRVRTELVKPKVPDVLVRDLVDRWLGTKRGLSPNGFEACEDASTHVKERWGDELADRITRFDVETWLADMPYSKSLKSKCLQCLSGAFKTFPAFENPCVDVVVGAEQRREARFLSVDELKLLADQAGHYAPLVMFLGTTGVRIGESAALDVSDVDRLRARARVRKSKNGEARDVPVSAGVMSLLDLERARTDPLFVTERGRRVLVDNWRARVFSPAARSLGLDMTIHDLRHTAASLAIASGADVKVVQRMLGHKTATLTLDWYGHLWDKNLDDVSARMDAALGYTPGTSAADDELTAKRESRRTRYVRPKPTSTNRGRRKRPGATA